MNEEFNEEVYIANLTIKSKCIKCGISGHIETYFCKTCKCRHLRCTNCSWRPKFHYQKEREEIERERDNEEIPVFKVCETCKGNGYVRK